MKRRDIRLIPLVVVATAALLVLKVTGLLLGQPAGSIAPAHATETVPFVPGLERFDDIITGAAPPRPAASGAAPPPQDQLVAQGLAQNPSLSERALLQRLQERREELERRAREIDAREQLLAAAERRVEERLAEIKAIEQRVAVQNEEREQSETQRIRGLVTMYENMRARDAARIFDRLEQRVLLEVVRHMNPRRMADVLAAMQPEAAERLTNELARRNTPENAAPRPASVTDLPKIEGRPAARNP